MRKSESILKLQLLGLNTLDCFITDDLREATHYLAKNMETLVSMRTERGYEYMCPFYYMIPGKEMVEKATKHLSEGYKLLLYPALPTKGCLAYGTVGLPSDGSTVVEYVLEEGKVRELDSHPRKVTHILPPGRMKFLTPKQCKRCMLINEVIQEVRKKCYGEPACIVEWSYYNHKVGSLKTKAIYWEIRLYEEETPHYPKRESRR